MNVKQSEEWICEAIGPITNLARIARLKEGCEIIRGLSIQKKPLVIRCAIKSKHKQKKNLSCLGLLCHTYIDVFFLRYIALFQAMNVYHKKRQLIRNSLN